MGTENDGITITNLEWIETDETPRRPIVHLLGTRESGQLRTRLQKTGGSPFGAGELDVTFRYQSPVTESAPRGILGVSSNVTGDFILEVATDAESIRRFVQAARRYGETTDETTSYAIRFWTEDGLLTSYKKSVFLVYAPDGALLRHQSLIPNGVEI